MLDTARQDTFKLRKGLDLPITGEPDQSIIENKPVTRVAVTAPEFIGLRPAMRVAEGQTVRRGDVLFEDKKNPGIRFTSPAAGTVQAIHRGDRRALLSVVISLNERERTGQIIPDDQVAFSAFTGRPINELSRDEVRALLLESGMWTAFRTRPFSKIPPCDAVPHSIFVTAMDTNPLAADANVVLEGKSPRFETGLLALTKLTDGKVYVCTGPRSSNVTVPTHPQIRRVVFEGPHPSGTPGVHIHFLDPVHRGKTVWHIPYQEIVAIGELMQSGSLVVERIIALAGPSVQRPRLLRTRLGAATDELTAGELSPGEHRVISGSVVSGRIAAGEQTGYLGRYHYQISVLREGRERYLFGWMSPGIDRFSIMPIYLSHFLKNKRFSFTTNTNGGKRAMVPIGLYEKVMPMDIMPTFLLRALLTDDIERAEQLGCLELDEEDLALCSFVCPSKIDYGPALRRMLETIEKEG